MVVEGHEFLREEVKVKTGYFLDLLLRMILFLTYIDRRRLI